MNQERDDLVSAYLGLQGFEVVGIGREEHHHRGYVKVVRVQRREGRHECPQCGRRHATGLFSELEPIRLRDCSIGDLETHLEVHPVRLACCGGTRVERLPFAMAGLRMTRRFFERLAALCTRLPVDVVAKMARLSWATVAKVDMRAIELGLGDRSAALVGLRWIGVDEVSRTGGREYFTIVTNLETGRVVWIGDGKGRRGLLPFLRGARREGTPQAARRRQRPRLSRDHRRATAARGARPRSLPHRSVGEPGARRCTPTAVLGGAAR
jgi:transposase